MKYKDHVYNEDLKTLTLWLDDVETFELENLLLNLKEQPKQTLSSKSDEESIFQEDN